MSVTFRANPITSEVKYRTLLESIDQGFCIIEVIFDERDKAVDYRFLEINPSFERQTGLVDARGKTVRQLVPQHEQHWFDIYGQIALTGEPARFEQRAEQLNRRWYDVYAWRHGHPDHRQIAVLFNDVTIRKNAEEALRDSEARYRSVLDLMPAAVYTCAAPSGVITFYNGHAARLWGRVPAAGASEERFCGSFRLWYPDGQPLPHAETPMALALREGREFRNREVVIERPDGSRIIALVNIDPLRDAEGRVTGAINVFYDVTGRRRTEDALRRSEARLEAELADTLILQDISAALLHERDPDALYGRIVEAAMAIMNSDFASMQQLYPERGKGGELRLLAFRGFSPQAAAFWEWVRADSDCTCGIALRRGTRVIEPDVARSEIMAGTADQATYAQTGIGAVQSTPLMSRGGTLLGMLSTHWRLPHQPSDRDLQLLDILARLATDLIERGHAEQSLGRLAAIVESSDDAIISKNLDGIITSWNRGAERLFGYTAQEAIGRPVAMLMPPERVDEEFGILEQIRRGDRLDHYETVRRRKDGTQLDVSLSVSPIIGSDGRIVGASKIARDITRRKRAEAALRDDERRKEEFIAMVSHELRNPLAPMRNAVTLLQQADDDAEIRRQASAILDRQVEHMTRLVEELLDISRISRGAIEVQKQEVDLAAIVRTAVETSRPLVEAGRHRLDITLPRTPVSIVADRDRMVQVLSNLLNNAAKYTPPGGRIGLDVSTVPNAAAISVRDNGIGISAGDLSKLFRMFTQLEGARRRAPGGMGVGLALARQLVELHGGTIEARSEGPGRGSEFTVRIPLPASDRPGTSTQTI